jgi:hypothetical protein
MLSIKVRHGVDIPDVDISKAKLTILCGICRDADAVTRWVVTEPLVEQVITYVCPYCAPVQTRAVERLVSLNRRLVVTCSAVS